MKKLGSVFVVLLAFVAVALFSLYFHSPEGLALAMGIPLLPRNMFTGRPSINRAINLNQGTFGEGGEELRYPIYDRMKMLNSLGLNTRTLFKTAVGAQRETITLTYADTNITQSEQVPSSQKWTLTKLQVTYMAILARTDLLIQSILDYYRTTSFSLKINSKDAMFILPLWKFGGHPQMISAPAVTVNSRYPQAIFSAVWDFSDTPIVLQANTNWGVEVEPQVASAAGIDGDFLGFEFDATRARAD